MAGQLVIPTIAASLPNWTVLFAREPEPDPDLDDVPTGSADRGRSSLPPAPPPRRSSRGPWLLLLPLLVVAGATFLYMEPEMLRGILPESVMDLISEAPQPPAAMRPEPGPEAPPQVAGGSPGNPPEVQPALPPTSPQPVTPGEPPPVAGPGAAPLAMPPPSAPPGEPGSPVTSPAQPSAAGAVPEPSFEEGQLVTIRRDAKAPDRPISLMGDAAGTKPGPLVRPGTAVKVLDGDFQGHVWVYAVRTMEGVRGWLTEEQLQAKP